MPRTINVEERQTLVSEAAWRVLVRDGLTELSVRKVAAEAGLPPSSLRYTFPTQASVRDRAVTLLLERMSSRIALMADAGSGTGTGTGTGTNADRARAILVELLPLDNERRTEMEVSLSLGAMAMTDEALRATHEQTHRAVRDFCAQALALLSDGGASDIHLEVHDVRATHALIDGLALHLVRQKPGEDTTWAVAVVDDHVRVLEARL
jgi:DNA-binding transcriptional regulator YbjK